LEAFSVLIGEKEDNSNFGEKIWPVILDEVEKSSLYLYIFLPIVIKVLLIFQKGIFFISKLGPTQTPGHRGGSSGESPGEGPGGILGAEPREPEGGQKDKRGRGCESSGENKGQWREGKGEGRRR
jgi:hypothetical protein